MNEKVIPYSPKNGKIGCMVGKEFKITHSVLLKALQFYITGYGLPQSNYNYGILQFPEKNSLFSLLQESYTDVKEINGEMWVKNELHKPLLLQPGKYLMFMKWNTPPGNRGKSAQTIGFIESENCPDISWMNWSGSNNDWHKDTGPHKGNFMIEPVYIEMVEPKSHKGFVK